jgi:perosamine synthetase
MSKFPTLQLCSTIQECMEIIDKFESGISYILSQEKLVGIVTDGDIRRALLNDYLLSDSVEKIMNKDFVSLPFKSNCNTIRATFNKKIKFIPLIDKQGRLVDVADSNSNYRIPVLEPSLQGNELKYVTDCIISNWISSQGKYVKQFENTFEEKFNGYRALGVTNGSTALQLALLTLGIQEGDEVIVPNLTFAATINSVIHVGAKPVICEINHATWCIEPKEIRKLINNKTKAIIAVHLYGQPCDMVSLCSICKEHQLFLIEDCAEAIGSKHGEKYVGTFGDASAFSFFGNKTITTGEGGMLLLKKQKNYQQAKVIRDHGMSESKKYWHEVVGHNFRLTNLQAAIGIAQMENFDDIISRKLEIHKKYYDFFSNHSNIVQIQHLDSNILHSNWLFGVVLSNHYNREFVIDNLLYMGIETRPFFYCMSEMDIYKNYKRSMDLKISHNISRNGISLPSSTSITDEQIYTICEEFINCLRKKY